MSNVKTIITDSIRFAEGNAEDKGAKYTEGYNLEAGKFKGLSIIQSSADLLESAVRKANATFDDMADLEEKRGDAQEVLYLEGRYKFYENFLSQFKNWLKDQDVEAKVRYGRGELLDIKDNAVASNPSAEERLMFALTEYTLESFEEDEKGNITSVSVKKNLGKDEIKSMKLEEFNMLFDFDWLTYYK
ncbi:hypothetical protein [Bacillus sp. ISTL8]|uniref:hypothetical protein n=1 Tax=Bacillus sp. ISTL8 TaxID=2596896 RepID=UPI00145693F9|nr:hypothetical protein [Bacillus sp. ISTL8]